MQIGFMMDADEGKMTPIKVANALIDALDACKDFPADALKEIVAYLSVYNSYAEGRRNDEYFNFNSAVRCKKDD